MLPRSTISELSSFWALSWGARDPVAGALSAFLPLPPLPSLSPPLPLAFFISSSVMKPSWSESKRVKAFLGPLNSDWLTFPSLSASCLETRSQVGLPRPSLPEPSFFSGLSSCASAMLAVDSMINKVYFMVGSINQGIMGKFQKK